MFLIYTPKDGERQEFIFKPGEFMDRESEQIEKVLDCTWDEFQQQVAKGRTMARRALLWTFLRRQHPVLRFPDVSFTQGELELEYDIDELQAIRAEQEENTDAMRGGISLDAMLDSLDRQLAKARPNPHPKAPARSGDENTSTP